MDPTTTKRAQKLHLRQARQLFGDDVLHRLYSATVSLNSDFRSINYAIDHTVRFQSTPNSTFQVLACKTKEKSEKEKNDKSKNYWRSTVVSPRDEDVCDILKIKFRRTGMWIKLKGGEVLRVSLKPVLVGECYGRLI